MLKGKCVVVGVCGGIAAYKVVEVVSRLRKLNAEVDVIMTGNAAKFVAPLTFQTISRNPVVTDMFAEPREWDIKHVSLAKKADLILVAPATANIIGKVAGGIADDMLSTTIVACKSPVLFVPAMNHNMYENPVVQGNINRLKSLGYRFIEPDTGAMAEGTVGKGRLPEPSAIVDAVIGILLPGRDFEGVGVLVTAGPTREAIDPVRFISNRSSGKMGFAIAEAAAQRGARVKLISGPVNLPAPQGVSVTYVTTANEMYSEVMRQYQDCKVLIMNAAVADYRVEKQAENKLKKKGGELLLKLIQNPDIAKELGAVKGDRILVGSCAETDDLISNAREKIKAKNLDLIVANDITREGAGFEVDTNIVSLVFRDGRVKELPLMSKKEAAHRILDEIASLL